MRSRRQRLRAQRWKKRQSESAELEKSAKKRGCLPTTWDVGTGVYCMNEADRSAAFRVPPSELSETPTIAVGEACAIIASLCTADRNRPLIYFGDAEFWVN